MWNHVTRRKRVDDFEGFVFVALDPEGDHEHDDPEHVDGEDRPEIFRFVLIPPLPGSGALLGAGTLGAGA